MKTFNLWWLKSSLARCSFAIDQSTIEVIAVIEATEQEFNVTAIRDASRVGKVYLTLEARQPFSSEEAVWPENDMPPAKPYPHYKT